MSSQNHHNPLHIFFFPFLAHGHLIPTIDMAKLFTSRGLKSTIITTPLNAPIISKSLSNSPKTPLIQILTIPFPHTDFPSLQGCENIDSISSPTSINTFFEASTLLQHPLEQVFQQSHPLPHCIVADMFFPWATDSAAKFGVPRIVFHGNCFFTLCATVCVRLHKPYETVSSDSEPFVIPDLPGNITMTSSQVPNFVKNSDNVVSGLLSACKESEIRSYGVVVNSFYELEMEYADYYRNVLGRKAWHIGPVSLCNTKTEEKANRGKEISMDEHECLKWLDTKKPNSVVYVCFGSTTNFADFQLKEIAMGLEASGKEFIWVVKKSEKDEIFTEESWLPEGFEERMGSEGKGMIIRGWAPQLLILEHEAIGVFVSHCGWNSTLEAISGGVAMVTWPVSAEQFYNEKLVTQVLKIGLPIGVKKWSGVGESVKWEAIEKSVKKTMEGEEAEEMRSRAKVLSQKAREAMQNGGSSYADLSSLIQGLASPIR
ncbi:scopoletin glucosyltransferase-like [Senna tora]|uniref:Scopoletin glucosyltransferase-like n=1 Tax=Senna tora TaxID=362788 RepID=A0A835CI45_9FABA|nr:scopoletin glucosyltransferase-like [Senna tora]